MDDFACIPRGSRQASSAAPSSGIGGQPLSRQRPPLTAVRRWRTTLRGPLTWLGTLVTGLSCQPEPRANHAHPSASAANITDSALALDIRSLRECEPEPHTTLGPQEYLLGVEIEVIARAPQVPANYYYASLRDPDGNLFNAGFVGCEPRLLSAPLASGQSAAGYANFRLPRSAKDLTLEYNPPLAGSEKTRGPSVSRKLGR